jgi:hypothetical protein
LPTNERAEITPRSLFEYVVAAKVVMNFGRIFWRLPKLLTSFATVSGLAQTTLTSAKRPDFLIVDAVRLPRLEIITTSYMVSYG